VWKCGKTSKNMGEDPASNTLATPSNEQIRRIRISHPILANEAGPQSLGVLSKTLWTLWKLRCQWYFDARPFDLTRTSTFLASRINLKAKVDRILDLDRRKVSKTTYEDTWKQDIKKFVPIANARQRMQGNQI
jgi:hypothetical protein